MALSIIIEDGTGLPNAESYISVADLRSYAAKRAVTLSVNDDDLIPFILQAADYIEANANSFIGVQQTEGQSMSFPRVYPDNIGFGGLPPGMYSELYPYGYGFDFNDGFLSNFPDTPNQIVLLSGVVPPQIITAQLRLAVLAAQGVELNPISDGQVVLEEKVGPLETKYSELLQAGSPSFPLVDSLLDPFLQSTNRIQVRRG